MQCKSPSLHKKLAFERLEPRRVLAPLTSGQELFDSFDQGLNDSFEYHANNGDIVHISIGESGAFDAEPNIQVFSPGGQLVATDSGTSSAAVQFQALQPGAHTILVTDSGNNDPMNYHIRALTVPGIPQLIPGRDTLLANGQEHTSSFELGSFNFHHFNANNGDTVHISLGETGPVDAEPIFQVFSPGGQLVATGSGSSSATIQFQALQPGTHTILVTDSSDNDPMNYRIRALSVPGIPQLLPSRDSVLVNTQVAVSSFPLGSFNTHLFTASNGDSVNITLSELGNLEAEPNLQVFSPGGQLVASNSGSNSAIAQFEAIQSGIYTLLVTDSDNNEPMDYQILATGISTTVFPSADFNNDGFIDGSDFLAWQRGFGTQAPNATKLDGDADNDTDTDSADLAIWENQFSQPTPAIPNDLADAALAIALADFSSTDRGVHHLTIEPLPNHFDQPIRRLASNETSEVHAPRDSARKTTQPIDPKPTRPSDDLTGSLEKAFAQLFE